MNVGNDYIAQMNFQFRRFDRHWEADSDEDNEWNLTFCPNCHAFCIKGSINGRSRRFERIQVLH